MFSRGGRFHVEKMAMRTKFSVYNFIHLLLGRISHELASGAKHFIYCFFSTTHIFLVVLGTIGLIYITICSLTLHLPIVMPEEMAQFKVIRLFLEAIPTPGWLYKEVPAST